MQRRHLGDEIPGIIVSDVCYRGVGALLIFFTRSHQRREHMKIMPREDHRE